MIYAVIALLVLIFVAAAALVLTTPSRAKTPETGELTPAALKSLALALHDVKPVGRAPSRAGDAFFAAKAYRRIVAADRDGVELERCESNFAEKYHAIAAMLPPGGYGALAALPHSGADARVLALAKAVCASPSLCSDREKLRGALTAFVRYTPLNHAEVCALPLAFTAAATSLWRRTARKLTEIGDSREAAFADASVDRRRVKKTGYLHYFARAGKRVDPRFADDGADAAFIALTTELTQRSDRIFALLNGLGETLDDRFLASLFPGAAIAESDADFAATDVASKHAYHARIAKLAARYGVSERTLAEAAVALGAERGEHFGVYLFDSPRLIAAKLRGRRPRRKVLPARAYAVCVFLTAALLAALSAVFAGGGAAAVICVASGFFAFFPVCEFAAASIAESALVKRPCPRLVGKPRGETCRTEVVMPVYASSVEGVRGAADRLAAIRACNDRDMVSYLLLCDLPPAQTEEAEEDAPLLAALAECGERGLKVMVRKRVKKGGKWRARDRKRGAIADYNELRLSGNGEKFRITPPCDGKIEYVVVVDEDALLAPGAIARAIDSIRHPLAKKYDMLAFGAYADGGRAKSRYALARSGGYVGYARHSDLMFDLCGTAVFCGKGIYRLEAFARKTAKLEGRRLLSHDIAEGAVMNVGAADVLVSELPPQGPTADFARSSRWQRGDLILLGVLDKAKDNAAYVYIILSNAVAVFSPIAAFALTALFFATGGATLGAAAAFACFAVPLACVAKNAIRAKGRRAVCVLVGAAKTLVNAIADFALLPMRAANSALLALKCAVFALFSPEKLTEWRTFASSDKENAAGHAATVLPGAALLTAFAAMFWDNFAFAMWAAAYLAAAAARFSLAFVPAAQTRVPTAQEREQVKEYAARTYAYFDSLGDGLPCDNVQIYPPIGRSATVSPTDLGFWLIADICAAKCGLISDEAAAAKVCEKLKALEKLPKWRGHLYNWYDLDGNVVPPEYVSFVDSGNFFACLSVACGACRAAARGDGASVASEMMASADFSAFFDRERGLFARGYDAKRGEYDGVYDLLASEARLAVAIGCAASGSSEQWSGLGTSRLGAALPVLASWSGTAFEYLMPELFVKSPPGGELERSVRRAVFKMRLRGCRGFWGISESGYHAFDKKGNYQYRAHGIDLLALSGECKYKVIAPYASALAAPVGPHAALKNLAALRESGYFGRLGFYEAIDFSCGENTVYSHMTHHQGMILAAMAELSAPGAIEELFASSDLAPAIRLLMSEPRSENRAVGRIGQPFVSCRGAARFEYETSPAELSDVWAASGGEYCVVADGRGCGYSRFCDADVNVFRGDAAEDEGAFGIFMYKDEASSPTYAPLRKGTDAKAVFSSEGAHFSCGNCTLDIAVPRGMGGEVRTYRVFNDGDSAREYTFVYYCRIALSRRADHFAHPCFDDMFINTAYDARRSLLTAERVSRERTGGMIAALSLGGLKEITPDCDAAHFRRLSEGLYSPRNRTGYVMSPCLGFSGKLTVAPGESGEVTVITICARTEEELSPRLNALAREDFVRIAASSASDGGVLAKYIDGEKGAKIFSDYAARLLWLPLSADAVRARSVERGGAAKTEEDKKTVVLKYGDCSDFAAKVKACTACALAGIDFLLVVMYKEKDVYDATVRRNLIEESGISDLERLSFVRLIDVAADKETERGLLAGAFIDGKQPAGVTFVSAMSALKESETEERVLPQLLECGCGGFDKDGAYVVTRRPTKPYSNVINLERGGIVVTENGGGFRWAGSAYFGKLAAWRNDFADDKPCEELFAASGGGYVRVNCLTEGGFVRHMPGSTTFSSRVSETNWDAETSVWGGGDFSATIVRTLSDNECVKRAYWVLRPSLAASDGCAFCACERVADDMLRAFNCSTGEEVFARCLGARAIPSEDAAPVVSALSRGVRAGARSPYPALSFEIETERSRRSVFAIVLSRDKDALGALTLADVVAGVEDTKRRFSALDPVKIESGDPLFDCFFNRWLSVQIYSSRIFGRCGYYQAGGAIGARDILQDAAAIIPFDGKRAKDIFLDVCAHQYLEGDVMHWWHPPRTGVRTKISDDKLFLPWFAARYVAVTGDKGLLGEKAGFLKSPPLDGIAEARYETPEIAGSGTVEEHCDKAIENALQVGDHGLLKIGGGDWNDALNDIGSQGRGESVWLTMFAVRTLRDWAAAVGYEKGQRYLHIAQMLAMAAENTFDGKKFARAFTDDGVWLGRDGKVCTLDLICQAWAQLSKIGDEKTRMRALDSASKLYDGGIGAVKLFDPPFDKRNYAGYISAYPPGVRENGGQYTHAAIWYMLALFDAGRTDEATRAMYDLCPSTAVARFGDMRLGEPYALPADVYSAEDKRGESGWTWYTGSAGWFRTAVTERAVGIEMRKGLIRIGRPAAFDPEKLKVTLRFEGTEYRIKYEKGDGDHIRSDGLSYLNCTEFRPMPGKGVIEVTRVYK